MRASRPYYRPRYVTRSHNRHWLFLALTLILIGYFLPWLPHEGAGLTFIGLELGEQAKFLPQVRSGEITPGRSLFYLPPITIALLLLLSTLRWPNRRWQTWAVRGIAVAVSLLALPSYEAIGTEPEEWLWRLLMVTFVVVFAALTPILRRLPFRVIGGAAILLALAGLLLPAWLFFVVRAAYSDLLRQDLGIGLGFWLNALGHIGTALVAMQRPSQSA